MPRKCGGGESMPTLLSIDELAPILKSSTTTIRRLIRAKKIPYRKIGVRYFFNETDIQDFLSNNRFIPESQTTGA